MSGVRTMDRHLKTIGLLPTTKKELTGDTTAIILIDDVWTSGAQMNSAATILKYHDFIPSSVDLLAYTLVKTTHPSSFDVVEFEKLLKLFDGAQNSDS
jgi:hypothetical protein